MSAGWDYAALSKAAKACGGPAKYADQLIANGKALGLSRGRIEGAVGTVIALVLGGCVKYGVDRYNERKLRLETEAAEAKVKFVEAMSQEETCFEKSDAETESTEDTVPE